MDLVAGAGGIFGGLAVGLAGGMTGAGMAGDGGGPGGGGINGIMMAAASGKFGGMGPGGAGQHVKANIDSLPDKVISIFISPFNHTAMYFGNLCTSPYLTLTLYLYLSRSS